ncbi:putative C2H2 finger domain protein [Aspergillus candidus]|uniref:DnaJ-domain-containing protein n=1 Tax=Aspergillus candidus TaxID=41067 RepID=A0A2I2FFI2_ASPCN|nr:DnaJ-domain-containing protein [Aspergillus candidus]PLB39402.1 DnaJ-domain-containing protein [Aspergillus candidus]
MGQSQSNQQHGSSDGGTHENKTDYYELLRITSDASGEDIKKAYRKRALELHPDRNYGNVEESTKLFAEVQSAYEVLSDPQERMWYDSHSEAFLGTDGASATFNSTHATQTTSEDVMGLFSQFSPRMAFSDAEDGFYGGLRGVFSRLAQEEAMACRKDNVEPIQYPTFGSRNDDFDQVVRPFYVAWSNFSTRKSFAWKDAYRYSEAPDRRVRRLMEKENKRLREEGMREFNEAVRSLVAFVKKRDVRYKINAKDEAQRQETLRQAVAAQAARSRAMNQSNLREHITQDWAKSGDVEEDVATSSDEEKVHFECVVCRKNFKSGKQYEAHERSKKHTKAVRQLQWEMRAEDRLFALQDDFPQQQGESEAVNPIQSSTPEPQQALFTLSRCPSSSQEPNDIISNSEGHDSLPSGNQDGASEIIDKQFTELQSEVPETIPSSEEADYTTREAVERRLSSTHGADVLNTLSERFPDLGLESSPQPAVKQKGKAKQKRAKKAQQAEKLSLGMRCTTCDTVFPSRTKLFSHVRELGHARAVHS